jgi:hypothetical protein
MPGKEKYIQASWQKEIFFVDLFFFKARFFRFRLNSSLLKRTPLFPERIAYTVARRQSAQSLSRRTDTIEPAGILCACRERPRRCRATEQRV